MPLKDTQKTALSLLGAVLAVALVVALSLGAFRRIGETAEARKQTFLLLSRARDLLTSLIDAETGQRGFALTGDEAFLEPYLAVRDSIGGRLEELHRLTSSAPALAHLDVIAPLADAKMAHLARVIESRREGDLDAVRAAVGGGEGRRLMDELRAEMRGYLETEEGLLAQQDVDLQANLRSLFAIIVIASLLALLLALSFAYSIHRESRHRLMLAAHLETQRLLELQERMTGRLHEANLTLQLSEERLSVTLNSIGDAVIATDAAGQVTLLNPLAERLTGWTLVEARDRPVEEVLNLIDETTRQPSRLPVKETLAHGTSHTLDNNTVLIARDGIERAIDDSCAPIRDREGRVLGAVVVFRDVTEVRSFEQTLRQKNVELEDATRIKSEFLGNMSHELRTPLNAIIGFSELLRDGVVGEMTEQQRDCADDIFGSGQHLLLLINDILDLSKVEAGKMTLDLESVSLEPLLANCLSIVREKAASGGIQLTLDAPDRLGSIQADGRKVKQIVYNLLSNGVKFTPDGGQVTLRARCVSGANVGHTSGSWPGRSFPWRDSEFTEFLEISVTDSGFGISPKGMEILFNPFNQIDAGLARRFGGTGLGLSLVRLLAELHGGTVAVESATGEGSRFKVWLPLRAMKEVVPTSSRAPATPRIGGVPAGARTVLVVEDDYKSAELIRVQLEAEGFAVVHAASAEEALVLAGQQPLALITLDIMLPNMDGWELLGRIKQTPKLCRIPVVILSIVADRNKGFALGAAAVMQKPVSRQDLSDALVEIGLFPLSHGETIKVLVVDDDPKAVDLMAVHTQALLGSGGTILRAYGGREAIAAVRRELPDLILLDLLMPEVSGFDVVDALQASSDTARIPVLVVTAKQITPEDRAALSRDVFAIMEKSAFDPERFTAEIRRALLRRTAPV